MVDIKVFNSREEWLEARGGYMGGSDAAAVLGLNPYKTNVELWEDKTGLCTQSAKGRVAKMLKTWLI